MKSTFVCNHFVYVRAYIYAYIHTLCPFKHFVHARYQSSLNASSVELIS